MVRPTALLRNRTASAIALLLAALLHAGCAAPLTSTLLPASRERETKVEPHAPVDPNDHSPRANAVRKATGQLPQTQQEAFSSVLKELQEIRAIDPEAERQLMADLQEAKPEHYPMIVDAFRTALAYRQQLADRQQREADGADPNEAILASDVDSFLQSASHRSPETDRESAERATAVQASLASARADRAARRQQVIEKVQTVKADAPSRYAAADHAVELASANASAAPSETVALRPAPTARALTPLETSPAAGANGDAAVASDHTPTSPGTWQAELESSIANLQRSISPQPSSVAELHDHMRLRTLQLLAGREEEAYRPIPGASPDQQDYWSKQLFAMDAYLDAGGKLDDKQRAAAALGALDEARAKLSELATLQIRNAAFVASVDGFGAYEPNKSKSFQPGQKVTLYAEVENFRSNADQDGYHTSLATSYQVLDSTGRRVDGKQFPDVSDRCRNRRRDFHMQYELPLPTRIYPGEYVLELTITDHNSGKIGQSSVPFEIAGDK